MSNEWRFDDEGNRNNTDKTDDGIFENGNLSELPLRTRCLLNALGLDAILSLCGVGVIPIVAIASMLTGGWLSVNPILLFGALIVNFVVSIALFTLTKGVVEMNLEDGTYDDE